MPVYRQILDASRPQLAIALVLLLSGALLRVALFVAFGIGAGVAIQSLPLLLVVGALQDAVVVLAVALPLSLFRAIVAPTLDAAPRHRLIARAAVVLAATALLYLDATEYLFFEEFDSRFNLVAVDYLRYPSEVFGTIDAAYPVAAILGAALVGGIAIMLGIGHLATRWSPAHTAPRIRATVLGANLLALVLVGLLVDPSALRFAGNRVADEIAANGVLRFSQALQTNDIDYPRLYLSDAADAGLRRVAADLANAGGDFRDLDAGRLTRSFARNPAGFGRANVVIIVEESLGANHVGTLGGAAQLTPELDALAQHGLLFTNAYATGTRTVRGLEAIVTSFPPIPSESIVRRPGGEHVANLGSVLRAQGYATSFVYGGYAYFDDMQRFFEGNGFSVLDRSAMPDARFANIWGVADEDLFDHALAHLDALAAGTTPFLSVILTTSNHKPFTFPPNPVGVPEKGGGRHAGVRYADHALGGFMQRALARSWATNTVFVVLGDHSARVYGAARIPLETYRIPVLLLAPGRIAPGRNAARLSQIDLAPTILGLLGVPYSAPFFGRDVLNHPDANRSMLFNHNHSVALWRDDRVVVLEPGQRATTYAFDAVDGGLNPVAGDPRLTGLAAAYFGTAYELFKSGRYR